MTPTYNTFVSANADGTLTVSWLGVVERWTYRPTGPTTFAKVSGGPTIVDGLVLDPGDRISFTVIDGHVRYLHTNLHTIALERVLPPLQGVVQISAFGTIVLLFCLSLLIWPLGAAIRRLRHRPAPTGGARAVLWLTVGLALALGLGLGTVALFAGLSSDVVYGPTRMVILATTFITVASVGSLALVPAAVAAWANRWFTVGGRPYCSLLALGGLFLLWWADYWNLLGFRF